jgi:hypothetical protein
VPKETGVDLKGNELITISPEINSASVDSAFFIALKVLNQNAPIHIADRKENASHSII